MCENGKIRLIWVKKGKTYLKKIDKIQMRQVFYGLAKGFSDDNEISLKLLDIIQKAEEIRLNKDVAESQQVPFIVYNVNGTVDVLRIRRYHKIVWAVLHRFFTE